MMKYSIHAVWLLANSTNTKCRPFHVKINCSKFRIDTLQQLCHVIFFIYLFVTSRKFIVWFISAKENYYILIKNSPKLLANITERRTSLSKRSRIYQKSTREKVESLKIHYCPWTSLQGLRFPVGFFCTYLLIELYTDASLCLM